LFILSAMTKPASPRPLEEPRPTGDARLDAFARVLAIVDRLRAEDGCPWDREQTVASLAPSLVEEAHEAVEAIDRKDDRETAAELGDLFMVIALIAKVAEQDGGRFDIARVAGTVAEKLVRRHPHVFGDLAAGTSTQVLANWEKIKERERKAEQKDSSALAGVPVALPALQRAARVSAKAIAAGFKWDDARGALLKVREEVRELEEAFVAREQSPERVAAELGDVLLATAFLGQYLALDPERATREALRRFETRFRRMEGEVGARLRSAPLDELMAAWERAKAATGEA
jgi:tetrapyrrole methylase family protein/MazG family protein